MQKHLIHVSCIHALGPMKTLTRWSHRNNLVDCTRTGEAPVCVFICIKAKWLAEKVSRRLPLFKPFTDKQCAETALK